MYCWSCGHANPDVNKFCGECGKGLLKPEQTVHEFSATKVVKRDAPPAAAEVVEKPRPARPVSEARSADTPKAPTAAKVTNSSGVSPVQPANEIQTSASEPPPKPTNPLIEEPRIVHEQPVVRVAAPTPPQPPTPIRDRVPNRITGPSFLGLSDEPDVAGDGGASYLLDEESQTASSPWRAYLMLALLAVGGLLVVRNWQQIRGVAGGYAQSFGAAEVSKRNVAPARVTASNEAPQYADKDSGRDSGKDSVTEESPAPPPAEGSSGKNAKTEAQQNAKLEKPQSDKSPTSTDRGPQEAADGDASEASSKPTAVKPEPAPAPAYDNSQLELAQQYLQGKGVQQDCGRGLELLRSAARQPNPKARIQMAALYSSGHCVSRDLAQAYNWFAQAQELEPHNRLIERNLDLLWARMSEDDRRRVLR